MEGFILAAGLGTRLRPVTNDKPKALVEVGGITLLERAVRRLEEAGIVHIVVNVHHFADKVIDFIECHQWQAKIDISDERVLLLNTGGGLKHAAPYFSGRENILIHNVDILSDIDLRDVERHHVAAGNLATLCVSQRETDRPLEFSPDGLLLGRSNIIPDKEQSSNPRYVAFSGVSVVSPELLALLPEADQPYSIVDEYIRLSHKGRRIGYYLHAGTKEHWLDVGKQKTLEQAKHLWTASSAK